MVLEPGSLMATGAKAKPKSKWFCYNSSYYKGMQLGDLADEMKQKRARELTEKYMANYGAHRKGMSPEAVVQYYNQWAERNKYEEDLCPGVYNGPSIAADEVAAIFPERREKVRVLDIACGTGFVGEELNQLGFKHIEGLDPSEGMLVRCRKKNLYKRLYCAFCSDTPGPVDDSVFDCAVSSGGMGENHMPCDSLYEMIRVVKNGGYIVIAMRREYLNYVAEYKDRLEPLMARLEQDHKWEQVARKVVAKYSFNRDGIIFTYRVTKCCIEEDK